MAIYSRFISLCTLRFGPLFSPFLYDQGCLMSTDRFIALCTSTQQKIQGIYNTYNTYNAKHKAQTDLQLNVIPDIWIATPLPWNIYEYILAAAVALWMNILSPISLVGSLDKNTLLESRPINGLVDTCRVRHFGSPGAAGILASAGTSLFDYKRGVPVALPFRKEYRRSKQWGWDRKAKTKCDK
jgi:hypothetical protein